MGLLGKVAGKLAGGLLKSIPFVGTAISIGQTAASVAGAFRGRGGAPPLPPITGLTGNAGTGNMTYGGNIRAAAEARGMKLGNPRSGRRMNPANIRALRRSIRRLGSAKKVFAQVFSAVHGHQPQKVKPKFGRKKR